MSTTPSDPNAELSSLRALHAFDTVPSWSSRVMPLLERSDVSAEEIAAVLAGPHVPGTRRTLGLPSERVGGAHLRLFDTLVAGTNDPGCLSADGLSAALADPNATGIDGLVLGNGAAVKFALAALDGASPKSIRRLTLYAVPSAEDLAKLVEHPRCADLQSLVISPGQSLGDARVAAVLRAPWISGLRRLVLGGCDKLANETFELLGAAKLDAIQSFQMSSMTWLPKKGAREPLLTAPWIGRLRVLWLDGAGTEEIQALTKKLDPAQLVALSLTLRAGKEPASPGVTKPLVAKLRACQSLAIVGPNPGSFVPGIVDLLRPIAGELEELRLATPPADAAPLAELLGPDWAGRDWKRKTDAGFSWRWSW